MVYWKDGTKSLIIGNDCYDIDQQQLNGNRDYIYYTINNNKNYKICHSKIQKRLNVRTTTQKSYKTLQKNLAKKHERTKGSKQLTALQRRNNRNKNQLNNNNNNNNNNNYNYNNNTKKIINKKRSFDQTFLEQGGHGNNTSDDNDNDNDDDDDDYHDNFESDSDNDDDDDDDESDSDDDKPVASRLN